ncbi:MULTISPECIES: DUF3010 family protein [Alteromonas]|jgi:hypothetical protein|uniref:DUF3010 family protein n=1 Tax=Alteromonas stellipolaris TaxID=233316 RepID=A0AAW7Z594_9ALTE|nr:MULTISPECIES: DUF3010 family protein [Alteromonas]AMJ91615.1 hypothetical protein AV940_14655 [Alteromonas sp. Mac2]ALM89557.1 hypothetical protein AOR13_505 [Alteromonas stellipolaris LMG 21856]AMJ75336.1 hypothetical protein AVL57_15995 [Alteromonas stellipolaris]AMJ87751.1 hypothetical protein AV939_14905 [Alteromonas sp. Mac1]AMJ95470.1 hypothetical protein AVL56_14930 [Alteromonas stellipolaris]
MKVCGVDLKGNEANVCLLSLIDGLFHVPDCRTRRLTLADSSAKGLKSFQSTFAKLVADYKIDAVIIRQRQSKGKFAGSAIGFKLEAAIELIEGLDVVVYSPTDIKESLRRNPIAVPFAETGLKQFQEPAFTSAYAWLMQNHYASQTDE